MEVLMAREIAAKISMSGAVIDIEHELKDEVQLLRQSNEKLTTQLKNSGCKYRACSYSSRIGKCGSVPSMLLSELCKDFAPATGHFPSIA
jgi:hypothetical protein